MCSGRFRDLSYREREVWLTAGQNEPGYYDFSDEEIITLVRGGNNGSNEQEDEEEASHVTI